MSHERSISRRRSPSRWRSNADRRAHASGRTAAALCALSLVVPLISCACAPTHEVSSFVAVHQDLKLRGANGRDILAIDEVVETSSSFGDEQVSLRPRVGDYEIRVRFDSRPPVGGVARYRAQNAHGLENPFLVLRGPPPLEPVVLASRAAEIEGLEVPAKIRARLQGLQPGGDETIEIVAFRYAVSWNELRVEGRAYVARTSHSERDLLLD